MCFSAISYTGHHNIRNTRDVLRLNCCLGIGLSQYAIPMSNHCSGKHVLFLSIQRHTAHFEGNKSEDARADACEDPLLSTPEF